MSRSHGKLTVVKLGLYDLSAYIKNSEFGRKADTEDTTVYGMNSKRNEGSLLDGTFKMDGVYETGASGPRAIIAPMLGQTVDLIRQPEGAGTGKPQDVVDLVVTDYTETAPVAGYVLWSMQGQCSGDVDMTPQT